MVEEPARVRLGGICLDNMTERQAIETVMRSLSEGRGGVLVNPNLNVARLCATTVSPDVVNSATLVLVDGAPLVWAAKAQGTPFAARIAGATFLWRLSEAAQQAGRSVYLLGGLPGAAAKARVALVQRFPRLQVVGDECPPVGFDQDPEYMAALTDRLRDLAPDIVFMALGFPKQELVSARLSKDIDRTWFICGGASLDFAGGLKRRAPVWLQRVGFEWLYRVGTEPRRLGPRYLRDAVYGVTLLRQAAGKRIRRRPA